MMQVRSGKARARAAAGLLVALGAAAVPAAETSTGGAFLPLGHGARAHGLGGLAVAAGRDDAAAYWNPANLAWMQAAGLTLMHAEILPGVDHGYDSASYGRAWGGRLGEDFQPLRPARAGVGIFVARLGLGFETADWTESTLQLAGACALGPFVSVGLGAKLLSLASGFDASDARGAGVDAALSVLVTPRVTAALVARDAWTRLRWGTRAWETIAPSFEVGAELRLRPSWSLGAEARLRERVLRHAALGVEWLAYRDVLALRGGWTQVRGGDTRGYPSAGAGFRYGRLALDYAASFDAAEALGVGQRVSLHVEL